MSRPTALTGSAARCTHQGERAAAMIRTARRPESPAQRTQTRKRCCAPYSALMASLRLGRPRVDAKCKSSTRR
eukprot:6214397-Pleurochrysis_carterae.AAC.2